MKFTPGVFCFVVVLSATAVGQDPKGTKPDENDPQAHELIATFGGHATGVAALAFSSDGRQVVSVCAQDVRTWDSATGKEIGAVNKLGGEALRRFDKLSTSASSVAFSRDGKSVAAGTNGAGGELPEPGEVWVWDLEKGEERRRFKAAPESDYGEFISIADVAFSPGIKSDTHD